MAGHDNVPLTRFAIGERHEGNPLRLISPIQSRVLYGGGQSPHQIRKFTG
jgi:hypothetical protein